MKKNVYIIEEHNEAFYVWLAARRSGLIGNNNLLLHFDDHSDFRYPVINADISQLDITDDKKVELFVRRELTIDSFIVPAIYLGLISEFCWIRQDVEKTSSRQMYVRTYNNGGKYFMQGNGPSGSKIACVNFQYIKTGTAGFCNCGFNEEMPVLLDIDLDYFSCCENPYIQNEIVIEITEQEYSGFVGNPYHYLHFICARAEAVRHNDAYFYILNGVQQKYQSKREVDADLIIKRIRGFVNDLVEKKIDPSLVTICRSRHSGFTPCEQWQFIENNLLSALGMAYETVVDYVAAGAGNLPVENFCKGNIEMITG